MVLGPFIIYIILIVAYFAVPSFRINANKYLGYKVAMLPIDVTFQNAIFFVYTLIFFSFVFVVTLQCSKHNKY